MRKVVWFTVALAVLGLAGCGAATSPSPVSTPAASSTVSPTPLESIQLGVGYVPNVQFAPFYVAQVKGFFAQQGLAVTLEYGMETDFVALTGQGQRQFSIASGDQVILARAQKLPVVYVLKWYQRFPVGVMALAQTGIETPQQLEGHTLGIPGPYGASYAGWKALAYAAHLDETKIRLESIGFTQAEAVTQGKVDAAVVYITNEPVQLRQGGWKVNVVGVSDYINMVSNGLITNETTIRDHPELVRRMVSASLQGLVYTLAHPDEAFSISRSKVPEITDQNAPTQRAVLDASLALWRTDTPGVSDRQAWVDTLNAMQATGLVQGGPDVQAIFTNQFVQP
jgi:NitT/TauT family transport system substrate-binding protein